MKEWIYRRMTYYSQGVESDIDNSEIVFEPIKDIVIARAIDYFILYDDSGKLYYPAKAYAVAIIYASLLSKTFEGSFYQYLKDKQLLDRDDYYVPYCEDVKTYEAILSSIDIENIDYTLPNVAATKRYFQEEFLLDNYILPAVNKV